jgi:hypothetical protein
MIDFWSILGHASTDDAFRTQLYTYTNSYPPVAAPNVPPAPPNVYACRFDNRDYGAARKDISAKIGPVSLMAIGEWFVICKIHSSTKPDFDTVSGTVQAILGGYASTDPQFYQALGVLILDSEFRSDFNRGNEGAYGFALSAPDRATLANLVGNGAFQSQAGKLQNDNWPTGGCKDMAVQWPQHPYSHSLEQAFK